ncbi:MAG: T9SS type A sorting domain-containing protein [Bacteroidales bacterium]
MDGRFVDWQNVPLNIPDPVGDGNTHDFTGMKITNDDRYLYLKISFDALVTLQDFNNINLYIDTDNNSSTGFSAGEIGADLRWTFGAKSGSYHFNAIRHKEIGLVTLPTHSSDTFEIAIARSTAFLHNIFLSDTIRLFLEDTDNNGDRIPNTSYVTYVFTPNPNPPADISLDKTDAAHLRLMSYNILFDSPLKPGKQPYFQRIFSATQPDIICFNEFFNSTAVQVKTAMDSYLPLNNDHGWYTVMLDQGNVTASRYPILQSWLILPDHRLTATLIDLPAHLGENMLVINAHFRCCTNDAMRQKEADALAAFLEDMKNPGGRITLTAGTPVILAGDLNLVGHRQQLTTILTGEIQDTTTFGTAGPPDWDGTSLEDLISQQVDNNMAYTWRSESSVFSPGRLDYIIYTNSALEVKKNFILQTESMSGARLAQYSLLPDDTREASDHLPVVVDFVFSSATGIRTPIEDQVLLKYFPNPVKNHLTVEVEFSATTSANIYLTDMMGKMIRPIAEEDFRPGIYSFTIDLSSLAGGVYLLQVQENSMKFVKKIIRF